MTAQAWQVFDTFLEQLGHGLHDLESDSIKCALIDSNWTPNMYTDATFSVIDGDEISGNGYTAGGQVVANITWDPTTGTLKFDGDNLSWTAGAGGLTARRAILYNATIGAANDIIACSLLDITPADVTAASGVDLNVNMHASGILTNTQP